MWNRGLTDAEAAYVSSSTATTPPELPIPGPPPPPPANPPQNTTAPSISQLFTAGGPTGTYFCNSGTWTNLPSPPGYTYRWIATENGKAVPIGGRSDVQPHERDLRLPDRLRGDGPGTDHAGHGDEQLGVLHLRRSQQAAARLTATSASRASTSSRSSSRTPAPRRSRIRAARSSRRAVAAGRNARTSRFAPVPRRFCIARPAADPQDAMQQTDYAGVTLDSDKRTTAVVYINTVNVPPERSEPAHQRRTERDVERTEPR